MSDEVTTHQVEGFCDGVMMKGDWQEFHINIGKQYPVKLSTKHDDVKALAAAAGTNKAIWTYTEKQGGPNPHRPGEFFKNRYLSNVEVGGALDPTLAGHSTGSNAPAGGGVSGGGMPGRSDAERISIERQTIIKAVLASDWKFTGEDQLYAFLDRMDRWMAHGRVGDAPAVQPAAGQQAAPNAPADDPDDIPF